MSNVLKYVKHYKTQTDTWQCDPVSWILKSKAKKFSLTRVKIPFVIVIGCNNEVIAFALHTCTVGELTGFGKGIVAKGCMNIHSWFSETCSLLWVLNRLKETVTFFNSWLMRSWASDDRLLKKKEPEKGIYEI